MPDYRQPVQEYLDACEALLKINELTEEEAEAVEEMFGRIAGKFLDEAFHKGGGKRKPSRTIHPQGHFDSASAKQTRELSLLLPSNDIPSIPSVPLTLLFV